MSFNCGFKMQAVKLHVTMAIFCCLQAHASMYIKLTHDGPSVQGGSITFQADIYQDGSRPSGDFTYTWKDNGMGYHKYESPRTKNTTSIWKVDYPADIYPAGEYTVEVIVQKENIFWDTSTSQHSTFEITTLLNGNMTIIQSNRSLSNNFVSSESETELQINTRKGDFDFIVKNATEVSTFWFIDCKYYGQTDNFRFLYNFTKPDIEVMIEALVIASFDAPTTSAPATTTSLPTTPKTVSTGIQSKSTTTMSPKLQVSKGRIISKAVEQKNMTSTQFTYSDQNISLPYVCINSSAVPPDPKKTYGYFHRQIHVNAPIKDITVEGTNWIKPWDMLSLNVSCNGSGPFLRCLEFHSGNYNVTGNETCNEEDWVVSHACRFSIKRYFLEPNVYTILVMLRNNISTQIYPVTINIYKVTAKPQLSVIVVPVSCSLAAVVLVVFGIAYYIQSRARYTIEVADFDFGQSDPEIEYKTFTERLRDSFNSTVRSGYDNDLKRLPSYGSMNR